MNILKYFELSKCYQFDKVMYFNNPKSIEMFLNLKYQFRPVFKGLKWEYEGGKN